MKTKLNAIYQKFEEQCGREKLLMGAAVFIIVILTLWIMHAPAPTEGQPEEMGVYIPKGQLIVPLVLANATAMSTLINRNAIVDLFRAKESYAMAENVRIIKLAAGEGPLFGALVPEAMAGPLQDAFSSPNLRAALRTTTAGPSKFHLQAKAKPLLMEVSTGDTL